MRRLLFADEAPISGKIEGSSGFAARFAALGARDHGFEFCLLGGQLVEIGERDGVIAGEAGVAELRARSITRLLTHGAIEAVDRNLGAVERCELQRTGDAQAILSDRVYWDSVVRSFVFAAISTGLAMGIGLDRLVMLICGEHSIRDVMAFPKTASAQDLMMDSPGEVDASQLKELAIKIAN